MALCGARGGDLRAGDSPAPTPPGLQVPEVYQKFGLEGWGVKIGKKYGTVFFDSTQNRLKRRSC